MSELAVGAIGSAAHSAGGNSDLNYCPISNLGGLSSLGYKCWRRG